MKYLFLNFKNEKIIKSYLSIFLCRLVSGFSIVLLSFLISNKYGIEDSGFFNFFWTCLLFFTMISKYGNDYYALKVVGICSKNNDSKSNSLFINKAISLVILFSFFFFFLFNILEYLGFLNFLKSKQLKAISLSVFAILPFTLVIFFSSVLKGFRSKSLAYILDQGGIAFFLIFLIFVFEFDIVSDLLYFFCISSFFVLVSLYYSLQYYYQIFYSKKWLFRPYLKSLKDIFNNSRNYFFYTLSDFILYWSPIILVSLLSNLYDTGIYSNILRLSQIIVFFMAIINTLLAPKLAAELNKDKINFLTLKNLFNNAVLYNFLIGLLILIIIIFCTPLILNYVGLDYSKHFWIIFFLYFSQLIKLINGPTIYFLNMSKEGGNYSVSLAKINFLLSISIFPLLIFIHGIIGASIAFFVVTLLVNVYAAYRLKQDFKISIFNK